MTQKRTSRAEWDRMLSELGIEPAPPNHPIYSEGPSITFLSRTPEHSEQKAIVSPLSHSDLDSD